ncbi:hypothetical protein GGR57DRAFT_488926 [Xylariaceae sp. FL1272]|nr:hypothetical protein GGR57DRAFT_488926 [Xylariaceae sp. FL1272]
MTSTAANQASNNTAAPAAPSYASAAGAVKKPATPVVATGSNQPIVATGSHVQSSHHAKSSSVSPLNGRPNIMPAVPAAVPNAPPVAHGTSNLNGHADHTRKTSVTMSANGPNSYSANGGSGAPKAGIQFGYQDSPSASHSTPQPSAAPIPIPGAAGRGVTEPRNSPSPIPMPAVSGGKPPSSGAPSSATLNFGSFDGDRSQHMRTPSTSQEPGALGAPHSPHMRRGSNVSDMSNTAGTPGVMGRGGFQGGRGGRPYNGGPYNPSMGYPPNFNRGQQGHQGRGGMAPNFAGNGRGGHQFNTPPPQNRSPALAPAMPQQPPNMPPGNMGNMPPMASYYYQQPGPNQVHFHQPQQNFERSFNNKNKKKGRRGDSEKYSGQQRRSDKSDSFRHEPDHSQKPKRYSKRPDYRVGMGEDWRQGGQGSYFSSDRSGGPTASETFMVPFQHSLPAPTQAPHNGDRMGISPDNLLTSAKQNFFPGYNPGAQNIGMPSYPMYPMMQQSPVPGFAQPHMPGPYNPSGGQPMSRSNSQISEQHRPASSTGQSQPPIAHGTPQQQAAQLKPAVVSSPQFARPQRKSAAISIKFESGDVLDVKNLKAPASPAPTGQQSRTPPVVASTPTPPPKTSTPKSFVSAHGRTDSTSNTKTAEEKRAEFMEKIKQSTSGDKAKEDEAVSDKATVDAEEIKAEPTTLDEVKSADDVKAAETSAEKKPADEKAAEVTAEQTNETEDDEIERMIREMEEEDARREKEQEEMTRQKKAEAEAKKKLEDESRAANAAENDRKLREQEREMERLEEEKERKRAAGESGAPSVADLLKKDVKELEKDEASSTADKLAGLSLNDKSSTGGAKPGPGGRAPKPQALNLALLNTKSIEPPQPSAALQSLKTARLLDVIKTDIYPPGINSPNPALNAAVAKKGTSFKYDSAFLLQFKSVFTEQPSVDFHQQVKNLIGDGGDGRSSTRGPAGGSVRQNTRGASTPGAPFQMGQFGTGSQLPPGTTSAQRFEMSSRTGSRGPTANPMASFGRPGAFTGGNNMMRTPSAMGSMPHSPRQGSRRQDSKRNATNAKAEAQAAKTMPLTAGLKIEALQTSTTGWKPMSVSKGPSSSAAASNLMDPAMVQRKVKAALNKMTPENFDRISDQILEIAAQSKEESDGRTLRQVIQLLFEKATDEAHWASMYAKFAKKMLETMSPEVRDENIKDKAGNVVSGGALFRKYLLNRCQEEFERGWKTDLPETEEGADKKTLEATMLSDEYYKAAAAKRRGLGLVQFIGELYKLGMLTERIMHECVRKLVDYSGIPDEAEVESLSKLLRTIGGHLDATDKGRAMMDAYFTRIQSMVDLPDMPSRLQFMLMDVVDLRKANWASKEQNKGPKTLEEVRAEVEAQAAQKAAEAARSNQRGPGGRAQLGRGDARGYGQVPQPAPNQVGMDDLRRLKGGASRQTTTNLTLGPMSMLGSRSNSGRRLGPGGALTRGADDSGASSRTGTPPVKEAPSSTNSFGLLASMESDHPGSPPSAAASPAMAKATVETPNTTKEGN